MVSQPESLVMPTEWISLVVKDSAAASVGLKICEAQVLLFHFVFFVTRLCSVLGDGSCAVYMHVLYCGKTHAVLYSQDL